MLRDIRLNALGGLSGLPMQDLVLGTVAPHLTPSHRLGYTPPNQRVLHWKKLCYTKPTGSFQLSGSEPTASGDPDPMHDPPRPTHSSTRLEGAGEDFLYIIRLYNTYIYVCKKHITRRLTWSPCRRLEREGRRAPGRTAAPAHGRLALSLSARVRVCAGLCVGAWVCVCACVYVSVRACVRACACLPASAPPRLRASAPACLPACLRVCLPACLPATAIAPRTPQ